MNERIEKLAVEARQYAFGEVENSQDPTEWSTKYYNEMFEQKFAELIVQECINCCDEVDRINEAFIQDYDYDPQNGPKECIQVIKEHFGVEE